MDDELDWIAAAERLIGVLARDNEAIRQRRWDVVRALIQEKHEASRQLEAASQRLGDPEQWPMVRRRRLNDLRERLTDVVEENERRLTVLMFAQRKVMSSIAEAVVSLSPSTGYVQGGQVARSYGGRAVACNQSC
jgi:exonuclease VII large subunit